MDNLRLKHFGKWDGGVNTKADPLALEDNEFSGSKNSDITEIGTVSKLSGFKRVMLEGFPSGNAVTSFFPGAIDWNNNDWVGWTDGEDFYEEEESFGDDPYSDGGVYPLADCRTAEICTEGKDMLCFVNSFWPPMNCSDFCRENQDCGQWLNGQIYYLEYSQESKYHQWQYTGGAKAVTPADVCLNPPTNWWERFRITLGCNTEGYPSSHYGGDWFCKIELYFDNLSVYRWEKWGEEGLPGIILGSNGWGTAALDKTNSWEMEEDDLPWIPVSFMQYDSFLADVPIKGEP